LIAQTDQVQGNLVGMSHSPSALIDRLDRERSGPLMAAMDACNARFDRGSVVPAWARLERARGTWSTKLEMRSPRYTMQVGKLPTAMARRPTLRSRSVGPSGIS